MRRAEWEWLRRRTFERDGYKCVECGSRRRLECDHVLSKANGGSDDPANLQTLCANCHHAKTRRENGFDIESVNEWMEYATASRFEKAKPRA